MSNYNNNNNTHTHGLARLHACMHVHVCVCVSASLPAWRVISSVRFPCRTYTPLLPHHSSSQQPTNCTHTCTHTHTYINVHMHTRCVYDCCVRHLCASVFECVHMCLCAYVCVTLSVWRHTKFGRFPRHPYHRTTVCTPLWLTYACRTLSHRSRLARAET